MRDIVAKETQKPTKKEETQSFKVGMDDDVKPTSPRKWALRDCMTFCGAMHKIIPHTTHTI